MLSRDAFPCNLNVYTDKYTVLCYAVCDLVLIMIADILITCMCVYNVVELPLDKCGQFNVYMFIFLAGKGTPNVIILLH